MKDHQVPAQTAGGHPLISYRPVPELKPAGPALLALMRLASRRHSRGAEHRMDRRHTHGAAA